MSTEFLDYVEDILDTMEKAEILTENVTYDQFEADFRINFAVVRCSSTRRAQSGRESACRSTKRSALRRSLLAGCDVAKSLSR
jgi:hypothetical protein